MQRTNRLPELLAPAGGEEAFYAAITAGADAIYVGGSAFNARAYAQNFDKDALLRCIALAHANNVRVYVAMNTLLWDLELDEAIAAAREAYVAGADALIVADVGLAKILREHLPDLPLHASTQLSLHSTLGAREVEDLDFRQVVLARELSKENIGSCVSNMSQEVEVFLHGALCVSHSGQCLFSSLVGGRSGNRGTCAQPCRLPYNGGYPLSLNDLSLADHITELITLGVSSLKIEGRMKSPAYVYGVTSIYRRLLNERRNATPEEKAALAAIFSRDGFTDGYFTGEIQKPMTGVRSEQDKENSRVEAYVPMPIYLQPLIANCAIVAGEPARLSLKKADGEWVHAFGDMPSPAKNAPLTPESVKSRLAKMGGTPYSLKVEDISLTLGEGLNLSPASLNALRRAAVAKLNGARTLESEPPYVFHKKPFVGEGTSALFTDPAVWDGLTDIERDYFSLAFLPLWQLENCKTTPSGVWLPPVVNDMEVPAVQKMLAYAVGRGVQYALVGNPATLRLAREAGLVPIGDYRLNITNRAAACYWQAHGVGDAVLSPELTAPAARDIGGRVIAYGRIPLMLTERCFMKENGGCCKCGKVTLTDRRGVSFPLVQVYPHRNMVLNSLPTYLGDQKEALPRGIRAHFLFTTETLQETKAVIAAYQKGLPLSVPVRRLPKTKV